MIPLSLSRKREGRGCSCFCAAHGLRAKKSLSAVFDRKGRYAFLYRGSTLLASPPGSEPVEKPLHLDGNGVAGPDWGRSELVFGLDLPGFLLSCGNPSASYEDTLSLLHPSLAYSAAYSSLQRFCSINFGWLSAAAKSGFT